jgi:hypothetical protein
LSNTVVQNLSFASINLRFQIRENRLRIDRPRAAWHIVEDCSLDSESGEISGGEHTKVLDIPLRRFDGWPALILAWVNNTMVTNVHVNYLLV